MSKAYEQTDSYIPKSDAGFRDWLCQFSAQISANPNKYNLCAADASVIANLHASYEEAYVAVQSTSTRSSSLIGKKDAIKASAVASVRNYAMLIKHTRGVPNEDKIGLGLHVNDPTPTPIAAPSSVPMLNVVAAFSGEHVLRYADENTPASRRKPHGAILLVLFMNVGREVNMNHEEARFVNAYGTQPIKVKHKQCHSGLTATYFGRWMTQRGLLGPWSLPATMGIAFGESAQHGDERGSADDASGFAGKLAA